MLTVDTNQRLQEGNFFPIFVKIFDKGGGGREGKENFDHFSCRLISELSTLTDKMFEKNVYEHVVFSSDSVRILKGHPATQDRA